MLALIDLAGGAWIFLGVVIAFLFAATYGLYTRGGSAINQRPYGGQYLGQGGARGPSVLHHDESAARRYTRGTRP
jgi:hypothetical protein